MDAIAATMQIVETRNQASLSKMQRSEGGSGGGSYARGSAGQDPRAGGACRIMPATSYISLSTPPCLESSANL
jgi:hypothetical protein